MSESLDDDAPIQEALRETKGELKRADHLIYVSLKYTRTVDVIKSVVERLINAFSKIIDGLLETAKEEGKIDEIPISPNLRVKLLQTVYEGDSRFNEPLEFYALLRKIDKAEFTRSSEYRRHVTMTAMVDGKCTDVDIDKVNEYFETTKSFVSFIEEEIIK